MNAGLAALLVASWQVTLAIELQGKTPGTCSIRYDDAGSGLGLAIEKHDAGTSVVTALALRGEGVKTARLQTANVDTANLLKSTAPHAGEAFRAEAVLEDDDAGALLVHDLAITGGRLEVDRGHGVERFELPHPLSREVVAQYLNCAGDLTIPY